MRILMTGATGGIAGRIRPMLRDRYGEVVLSARSEAMALEPGETYRRADLGDPAALRAALDGIDGVIHLGGRALEADWPTVEAANITGLHNLYEAAHAAGTRRVIS